MARDSPGILHDILGRAGRLRSLQATSGMMLNPGTIYVPPPDHHLILDEGVVLTAKGPRENGFRPAIDPLFRSAAYTYGPGVIGIVLTGELDDGAAGLWDIKQRGGVAVVQHPDDAQFPSMPLNAIRHVAVDHIVPVAALAPLLVELTAESSSSNQVSVPAPAELEVEVNIAKGDEEQDTDVTKLGEWSAYACPECHGVLLQMKADGPLRFRCHTGHAYTVGSLIAELENGIEAAAWTTIRAFDEAGMLLDHLARHLRERHDSSDADRLMERGQDLRERARAMRRLSGDRPSPLADR
jgi:two-component system chemotaxis response regulator CheB